MAGLERTILVNAARGAGAALAVVCIAALSHYWTGGHAPQFPPVSTDDWGPQVDYTTTGSIQVIAPLTPQFVTLREALDALDAGDLSTVFSRRDSLPVGSLERRVLNWALVARSADPGSEANEIADWPGLVTLRRLRERDAIRGDPDPKTLIGFFTENAPLTLQGKLALARAKLALGDKAGAAAVISPLWREEKLEAPREAAILKEFSAVLTRQDHRIRMERMFYADRVKSAQRVAGLAEAGALSAAWAAAIRNQKDATALLDKVPPVQRSAGYYFAKSRYLRRAGKYREAADTMLLAPRDADALLEPDLWWQERRVLSRELLDIGDAEDAYRLAAAHAAESPEAAADAEFHAGWYALRFLNRPQIAASHFARIGVIARGATSTARAYYWLGRATEAGAPGNPAAFYQRAAMQGTAFYGQLAAAKLGRDAIPVGYPVASDEDRSRFEEREAVKAISLLEMSGHGDLSNGLYRGLARSIDSPGELALLCDMAQRRDRPLALRLGKIAAARGLPIGALAHPTGAIPQSADISGAGKALAYAVARQESEFNTSAVSRAGARGLLQLLPGTARDMAKASGLAWAPERLTTDAAYNATLGSAFLSNQLARFSGSYVMTFAGYNAGPRRARDWADRYGDPRQMTLDEVVDWIERIPFTETRHYVQRVMENYQVYKSRLTGRFEIGKDLVNGR